MANTDYTGQTIDNKFSIVRLLGEGGMGSVYLGRHTVIGKKVAVKFLHAEFAQNESVVQRFYQEAQAAAAIEHRNIVDVVDVGVSQFGEPFLVMEYLEGESLASLVERSSPLSAEVSCGILAPVLSALGAAHERGIIHRDLKPENIFLARSTGDEDETLVKLIDFGISKITGVDKESNLTQTGTMLGTPSYMSPEQARADRDMDHRTDIFSLGVILFEMLAGDKPWTGENYNDLLINLVTRPPRPPRSINPDFPLDLEPIVMRALSKVPMDRFENAESMLNALKGTRGFVGRRAELTKLCSTLKRRGAVGDVGDTFATPGSGEVASDILKQIGSSPPPPVGAAESSLPAGSGSRSVSVESKGSSRLIWGTVWGLVVLGAIGAIAFWRFGDRDGASALTGSEPIPVPLSINAPVGETQDDVVQIKFNNVPTSAKIYLDGALTTENPHPVKRGGIAVRFSVEDEGFEPFVVAVVPSKDREISITMNPIPVVEQSEAGDSQPPKSTKKRRRKRKPRKKTTAVTPPPVQEDKAITQGGRNTKFSEDFN